MEEGDFEQAVEWFGKAIDADGGDNRSGQLKELLSNRSAARLKARRRGRRRRGRRRRALRRARRRVGEGARAPRRGAVARGRGADAARAVGAYSRAELEPAGAPRATASARDPRRPRGRGAAGRALERALGRARARERVRAARVFALAALVYVGTAAARVLGALAPPAAAGGALVELSSARRARLVALLSLLLARALDLLRPRPPARGAAASRTRPT